jgi:hypothetical protein
LDLAGTKSIEAANDIGLIELNEALPRSHWRLSGWIKSGYRERKWWCQSLWDIPLGCTGAKLSVQLFDEMKRRDKYGIVTMCVGTGQVAQEFMN